MPSSCRGPSRGDPPGEQIGRTAAELTNVLRIRPWCASFSSRAPDAAYRFLASHRTQDRQEHAQRASQPRCQAASAGRKRPAVGRSGRPCRGCERKVSPRVSSCMTRVGSVCASCGTRPGQGPRWPAPRMLSLSNSSCSENATMLDIQAAVKPPIPVIEVNDYIELGRLVAEWAIDPAGRPKDVAGLRGQLRGVATLPDRIVTLEFVQDTLSHLILRLPAQEMVKELSRPGDRAAGGRTLPAAAVLHRSLPAGIRAGDDAARHPAGADQRLHHCPVPLTSPVSRRNRCARLLLPLTGP